MTSQNEIMLKVGISGTQLEILLDDIIKVGTDPNKAVLVTAINQSLKDAYLQFLEVIPKTSCLKTTYIISVRTLHTRDD